VRENAPQQLTLSGIEEARAFLAGRLRRTPVEESPALSAILGVPAWLKLESLQVTGSFKIRGALFRLSRLTEEEKRAGIATCSAGNHGKALAYAARSLGLVPTITVPSSVDDSKYRAMVALGAEVVRSEFPGYDDTEQWAIEQAARTGKVWISAFDDEAIMAGNGGTLALEILEDVPDARGFVLPVGGGGMSGGLAFAVKEKVSGATIVGCNHELSPALALSLERGEAVTRLPAVDTSAGGIEGGIGRKTFEILRSRIDRVALVSEREIFEGVRWMLEKHQHLIEPSAAAAVAACLTGKAGRFDGPVVVVISGRNVSLETLKKILF
jgi:threonine dehydratase